MRKLFAKTLTRPGSSVGRASDFKSRCQPIMRAFNGNKPTVGSACCELLGSPDSLARHSRIDNDDCNGMKSGKDWVISRRGSSGFEGIGFRD